jgi:5-methylcytosine-specific restriction endonuclease McrA
MSCLDDLKSIIRKADYDNTYKMAWAKALVEKCITAKPGKTPISEFSLRDIASLMVKYYWNQTIYFHLIQGSNLKKPPMLLQLTEEMINEFFKVQGSSNAICYERAILKIEDSQKDFFERCLDKALKIVKKDVAYRFTWLGGKNVNTIYEYQKGNDSLFIPLENMRSIAENSQDLFDLINYRWSLILETFNSSPRINKKVRIMDERDIKRSPLERFDKYLDVENPDHICFICGKKIEPGDLSRDHVIPWSYLYSDDLWNLVYVHKECNSSKSNVVPSEDSIKHLEARNIKLYQKLSEDAKEGKDVDELKLAIDKHLVDEFYIGCKR